MPQTQPSFFSIATERSVVLRAGKIALIVGLVLAAINHGDRMLSLSMSWDAWLKVGLTFGVPYLVSTYSSVQAVRERERQEVLRKV
ncbi:MAG: nitrate/nitrite transporter NrtS [Pseudomonadota bacterium]